MGLNSIQILTDLSIFFTKKKEDAGKRSTDAMLAINSYWTENRNSMTPEKLSILSNYVLLSYKILDSDSSKNLQALAQLKIIEALYEVAPKEYQKAIDQFLDEIDYLDDEIDKYEKEKYEILEKLAKIVIT